MIPDWTVQRWRAGDPLLCRRIEADAKDSEAKWSSLHESAARSVLRIDLAGASPVQVVLKRYRRRRGLRGLRDLIDRPVGHSPAQREWDALTTARHAGLSVPWPLAYGDSGDGGSFLVTQWVGGQTLIEALRSDDGATRMRRIEAIANLVHSVHSAGFAHGDLHLGNLRLTGDSPTLLDLQKFRRVSTGRAGDRAQHADWARLIFSLERATHDADLVSALHSASRLGAALDDARIAHIKDHQRGRTRRHLQADHRWVPVRNPSGLLGFRDRDLPPTVFETAIDPSHGELLDADRKQRRVAIHTSSISGRELIRKRVGAGDLRRAIADRFRGSPAARAFIRGQADRLISDRAAPALGFLERRRFGVPIECWLLLDKVGEHDLDRYAPTSPLEAQTIATAVATWIADQHARGLGHRDAKAGNIRLRLSKQAQGDGMQVELWWVDLEDLRGPAPIKKRQRMKSLVQLNASLPDAFYDPGTRRRALETYCDRLPFDEAADRLIPTLVRESLARNHRWRGEGCSGD